MRYAVERVFAGQKHGMGLVVRTVMIVRARIKIGMALFTITLSGSPGSRDGQRPHNEHPALRGREVPIILS